MTDKQYVKKMTSLYEELGLIAAADTYDHDAFLDVHSRILALHCRWLTSRRRRPWFAFASCIFLLIILVWIVYTVLSFLYTRGTQ